MDWSTVYNRVEAVDFTRMIQRPDEWQVLLAERIGQIVGAGSLLEAGCGFGLTSLLVGERAQRTLLDLEPKAVAMAQGLFAAAGQWAEFVEGDLFSLPFADDHFAVTFNAGVLEHFDLAGRRAALAEMVRVTRPGGRICVAIPNHYSVPYRYAYVYRKAHGTWPFPDEEQIFDFSLEIADLAGVIPQSRETVAEKTSFYFLSKGQKLWFRLLHRFKKYEGYLTIVMLAKTATAGGTSVQQHRERTDAR